MKNIFFFILFFLAGFNLYAQVTTLESAMPTVANPAAVVKHHSYILEYSEQHEQAKWVVYRLCPALLNTTLKRADNFRPDSLVITGSADDKDYVKCGFDRGHLKPANDSKTSAKDMSESFYYSNMSPQDPSFNRGIWKSLEEQVHEFANKNKELWVVTGPILRKGLKQIGENQVSVPEYYYKVLLDNTPPGIKAIAFILPNSESDKPLESFACSVDAVEKLTNIDFFPRLDDKTENAIEAAKNIELWFGKPQTLSANFNFIGNTSSLVFHKATCKNANCKNCTIKFKTAKEAIQAGYHSCSQCKP
jgi:endonuclease G, mitochondrial